MFNHVWLFVTSWIVAHQAPLSLGFFRQEYGTGSPFPSPKASLWPWDQICISCVFCTASRFFTTEPLGKPFLRSWSEVKWSEFTQLYLTLCYPMDCSPPGSSVHGIFQARILEWVAISFSRRSSRPRDRNWVSRIVGRCFTFWATREVTEGGPKFKDLEEGESLPKVWLTLTKLWLTLLTH